MKTIGLTALCLLVCILTQTGCCRKKAVFSNELEGTLTIIGSSSTQEVCDALANAFSKQHKKIEVVKSGAGSAQAAIAVSAGTAQIGDLSRELNFDEHPEEFDSRPVAIDGIAVCVNLKNKISALNSTQLKGIFTGKIKNWAEIGGSNSPIVVLGRDEASGTKISFERLIGAENSCAYLIMQDSNGKIKEKIKNDENAIGYISFSSVDDSVKATTIDGVAPTKNNILNSSYKLHHPFIQIVKKGCCDEIVNAWFDFIGSKTGQKIVESAGLTPISVFQKFHGSEGCV